VINDQFAATKVVTSDGRIVVGRLVNIMREQIMIQTDMLQPAKLVAVRQSEIADMRPSDISLMPSGLLDSFRDDEVADLMAYLLADR
jgi:putative heme-binding domain-containing protein